MKAFNSRKTCKQHWLFKNKQHKLSLTNNNGICGVFKAKKIRQSNDYAVIGDVFANRYCFNQINKILIKAKCGASIGQQISFIEDIYGTKIKNLGLTRQDFIFKDITEIAQVIVNSNIVQEDCYESV